MVAHLVSWFGLYPTRFCLGIIRESGSWNWNTGFMNQARISWHGHCSSLKTLKLFLPNWSIQCPDPVLIKDRDSSNIFKWKNPKICWCIAMVCCWMCRDSCGAVRKSVDVKTRVQELEEHSDWSCVLLTWKDCPQMSTFGLAGSHQRSAVSSSSGARPHQPWSEGSNPSVLKMDGKRGKAHPPFYLWHLCYSTSKHLASLFVDLIIPRVDALW